MNLWVPGALAYFALFLYILFACLLIFLTLSMFTLIWSWVHFYRAWAAFCCYVWCIISCNAVWLFITHTMPAPGLLILLNGGNTAPSPRGSWPFIGLLNSSMAGLSCPAPISIACICNRATLTSWLVSRHFFDCMFWNFMHASTWPLLWWV